MGRVGALRCLLAAVLFGASAPAASVLAGSMPALVLAGLLYVGAGAALLPAAVRNRPTAAALRADRRSVAVAVVAGGAAAPALLMVGLAHTDAAGASLLLNLELVATVSLSALLFGEHLGRRVVSGAALVTLAGVVLVWQPGGRLSGGALAVLGACVLWGLDNSVTARVDQLAPEHLVVAKGAVAGVANTVLGLLGAGGVGSLRVAEVAAALLIGAVGYGASMVLWVRGRERAPPGRRWCSPPLFIGAVVAWVGLQEQPGARHALAFALAAAGVAVAARSAHVHPHVHRALVHAHDHLHDEHHRHRHDGSTDGLGLAAGPGWRRRNGRHTHVHAHPEGISPDGYAHPHVPDLHHHHDHG
ncbi:MAG: DMT family transporter [Acidimicrobiales bacterium]